MNATAHKTTAKVSTKVSNENFNLIIENKNVNLLGTTKKTTKEIQSVNKAIIKDAKKLIQIEIKEAKVNRSINATKLLTKWLDDTQSKTAIEKYVKDEKNSNFITPLLFDINKINNSNILLSQVNKQLFKFGYLHELNKLDFDGNVIENKNVFSMKFFATASNSLLNRFAKYGENTDKFNIDSKKATEKYLQNKYNTFVKNAGTILGTAKVATIINDTIKNKPTAKNQYIVNKIKDALDALKVD